MAFGFSIVIEPASIFLETGAKTIVVVSEMTTPDTGQLTKVEQVLGAGGSNRI